MKVKILLVPLFIVISIGFSIWMVYPTFVDWSTKREDLRKAQERLVDIEIKLANTEKLKNSLEESQKEKEIIGEFLPESQNVEEVFDALSSIASSENLSIAGITIDKPEVKLQALNISPEETGDNSLSAVQIGSSGQEGEIVRIPSQILTFKSEIELAGEYGRIKSVIGKIGQMRRFNNLNFLEIKNNNREGEIGANLLSTITLDFNYLEKVRSVASVNNRIFSSGGFEMDPFIKDLERHKNGFSSNINLDGSGKSNPFLP